MKRIKLEDHLAWLDKRRGEINPKFLERDFVNSGERRTESKKALLEALDAAAAAAGQTPWYAKSKRKG